jgi:hypothetical protein
LEHLSNTIGSRLSGSTGAEKQFYTLKRNWKLGLDKVYLQEVMVPKWVRGEKKLVFTSGKTKNDISICALGGSVATLKRVLKQLLLK